MKEVKVVEISSMKKPTAGYFNADKEGKHNVEQELAKALNEGWEIAGAGGESLTSAFVILVRDS